MTSRACLARRAYRAAKVAEAQQIFIGAHPLVPIHLPESLELLVVAPISPRGRTRSQMTRVGASPNVTQARFYSECIRW